MDVDTIRSFLIGAPWILLIFYGFLLAQWGARLWTTALIRPEMHLRIAVWVLFALGAAVSGLILSVEPEAKKAISSSLIIWTIILVELTVHAMITGFSTRSKR